jgi:hypothetical protein
MYVDVCVHATCGTGTGVPCTTYHLCAVCVCVLLYLPVSYRAHLRFLPCSLFSSTTVSAISCSTHTHNSHSQLTLTTSRMCTVPSVARSTPHTMNDECIAHTCIIYVPPYHTFCTNCLFFGSHFAVDFDLVRCLAARALEMDRSERGLGLRELE